ncbi:hypothetical protein HB364_30170 [Pseudoflavitalea sp. X16]|uniref:hypothetical protein n=1 Tax=Paraflavitalea devenefica TaxID=2716334 RepID=UPI001423793B|nr:hypothetical protein [Paraflavitalea devenefica]NII29385.1 hypothetical protein [Paraflavitalea devenefica]
MKRNIVLLFLLVSWAGYGQNTINNYKYVLVPEKFDFSREANQYGLNFLAKSLLENKGFSAYFDNQDIPKDLAGDRCNALKAEVTQRKAIFATNLTLVLKDCQGNIVFKSKEGKSREKDYGAAYEEALKDAFKSLNDVPYTYTGTTNARPRQTVDTTTAPSPVPATTPVAAEQREPAGTLYAQATANGFQLIDTTPKIVLTLLKTSAPDYFIASKGTTNGIVFKKTGEWFFEYYSDGKLISEKLLIKF